MTLGTMLRSTMIGAACVMMVAAALAETAETAKAPEAAAPAETAPKAKGKRPEKAQSGAQPAKAADSGAKPKRGQFSTESEARARCRGEVVWVDKNNFNHYPGSREYGKKPGAFACENG